ncbi:MAG TPA: MBL fold metallo-hydrolase [Roseateles sp.]
MSEATPSSITLQPPSAAPSTNDELRLFSFNVGHGDCTLLEFHRNGAVSFRCLVDAGQSLPPLLIEHMKKHPRKDHKPDIDVVVLSHVDADHQGGLPELINKGVVVGEYLGPCLPTFRRLKYLFAKRVQTAVDKAVALEDQLRMKGVAVSYPLEGFSKSFAGNRVVLSVISPAARLLEALSTLQGNELAALLTRHPLPLEWLLEPRDEDEPEEGNEPTRNLFRGRVSLAPSDFHGVHLGAPDLQRQPVESAAVSNSHVEPEFFGNGVLNDTSLVIVLDVYLDATYRRRVVLTGDQENWTYIAARHPMGLGADVLKAPHHGGRVYLQDCTEAIDSLYLWLRPRTVVVSAKGRHHLPRTDFRDSVRKIGAALLCPNVRGIEPLSAGALSKPNSKSCFEAMSCTAPATGVTTVRLTAAGDSADSYACIQGSGHSGAAPIVVLRQDVIPASESLVRYTRRELEEHGEWIKRALSVRHNEFVTRTAGTLDAVAVRAEALPAVWQSIEVLAKAAGRHGLVADPGPVLSFGLSHRLFWASIERYGRHGASQLYRLPTASEIDKAVSWLAKVPRLLLSAKIEADILSTRDPIDILATADWAVVDALLGVEICAPSAVIATEVRPLLLPRIAKDYSLRACSARWPHDRLDDDLHLLLERKPRQSKLQLPPLTLCGSDWDSVWGWAEKRPTTAWESIRRLASSEILLGNALRRSRGYSDPWMKAFYNWQFDEKTPFAKAFLGARWVSIW